MKVYKKKKCLIFILCKKNFYIENCVYIFQNVYNIYLNKITIIFFPQTKIFKTPNKQCEKYKLH